MAKPIIILVHGVGEHTGESFTNQCMGVLDWVSTQYAKVPVISEACDIKTINYDDIFTKVLDNARSASATGGAISSSNRQIVSALLSYQNTIAEDNFFTKNALDAVVYKSFLSGAVEADVANEFIDILDAAQAGQKIHIIAHSLGTTVIHNVLHRLYATHDFDGEFYTNRYLHPAANRLASITMLANVSRLFPRPVNPYNSVVRPGSGGVCEQFIDARHGMDPIPLIRPFKPHSQWDDNAKFGYFDVLFDDLINLTTLGPNLIDPKESKLNVHAVEHYLSNADVHVPLFNALFPSTKRPNQDEIESYRTLWHSHSLEGNAQTLRNRFRQIDLSDGIEDDKVDIKALLEKMQDFFDGGEA